MATRDRRQAPAMWTHPAPSGTWHPAAPSQYHHMQPQGAADPSMTIEQLERQLLQLPAGERARTAKRLIESLDDPIDEVDEAAIEAAWMVEIERRIGELERGEAVRSSRSGSSSRARTH